MAKKIILTDNANHEIELDLDRWEVFMTIKELDDPENSFATANLNKHMIDELVKSLLQLKEELDSEDNI